MNRKRQPSPTEEPILRLMSDYEPVTPAQYAELSGIRHDTAVRHLLNAWDRKWIYIARWERRPIGRPVPHYALGNLPDAPQPRPLTNIERARASYERRMADESNRREFYDRRKAYIAERLKAVPALVEHRRAYQTQWSRNMRLKQRGGPAPTKCPIPRPKFYRNIFDDMKEAA